MAWPVPVKSKNQVRNTGKRLAEAYRRDGVLRLGHNILPDDFQIIQNWRASHGAVLNTAQAWLRRLENQPAPVVGQRLKRFETIVDKIITGRSKDLSTMHDIAGVRAIFRSEVDLKKFQEKAKTSKAKHELLHPIDKFDYIQSPKSTGYRGIHLVYARQVQALSGIPWNGLRFEVQLRTAVQHAWATAIEVYDSTAQARFKFEKSTNPAYEQFQIISEMLARIYENTRSCMPHLTDKQLLHRHLELDKTTHMVSTIQSLVVAKEVGALQKNTILQRTKDGSLHIYKFQSLPAAIKEISKIEDLPDTENAVLVGSTTPNHIRDAFRNYFDDTTDFIVLLNEAIRKICDTSNI